MSAKTVPGEVVFSEIEYMKREGDPESFETWIQSLLPESQKQVHAALAQVQNGSIKGLVHLMDNIFEVQIFIPETIFVYVLLDSAKNKVVVLRGYRSPV